MPSVLPSDLETRWVQSYETKLRLESISFFLVGLLASIVADKFLWNSLASSVPSLPRLDFVRALAVVALWGLMIGEVRSQFEPWGKPNTYRSLELGLNRHPRGFGGPPSRDSVMFLMTDGSVRTIRDTVDPEVLRSLSGAER